MSGKSNRHDKFLALREEHPVFVYESFDFTLDAEGLRCVFRFRMGDKHSFSPSFFIPRKPWFRPDAEILPALPGLLFPIGMIEGLSYWKTACPPVVEVKAGGLTNGQAEWWRELFYKGLGEFLYLNGIEADPDTLVSFINTKETKAAKIPKRDLSGILIPVGGGKDSVVTLELLGNVEGSLPLVINPTKAAMGCIKKSGVRRSGSQEVVEIRRRMDPLLLQMNEQGFLNGHTPFSALLAFYTLLAAVVAGKKYIALSNESSANEPTIPGTDINHQFSKTYEFETAFRNYVKEFLSDEIEYFSFLRPLHEIQIASLFSKFTTYHEVFRSCNVGSKTGTWCGKCSKCLFTFIILSPFLSEEEMIKIFDRDLFADPDLSVYFGQLTGIAPEKPFECVGTVDEVNAAVQATIRKRKGEALPLLLAGYGMQDAGSLHKFLGSFDEQHHIPVQFIPVLKDALHG